MRFRNALLGEVMAAGFGVSSATFDLDIDILTLT